jgi:hypothetical protein
MSHNSLMQAINCSSFAFLESRLSSAFVCFLWGASSGTPCIDWTNKARPILIDVKGCTKCCLAIFHQLFQKVTAQIPSNFTLNF